MLDPVVAGDGGAGHVRHLRVVGPYDGPAGGRHRVAAPESRLPKVVVGAVVLLALAGTAIWFTMTHFGRSAPPNPIASVEPAAPAEATAWMRENLPTSSRLLTDGVAAPVGYPSSSLANAQSWHDFDYLLTTQTGTPSPNAIVAPVWPSSTPVAVFDGLQVRHIASDSGGQPFNPTDDLAQRTRAGAALLRNPHLDVSPGARTALERGELDLRVAAVLSGLSSQVKFSLQDVTPVPVEAAAGTPVRAITIYPLDTTQAIRDIEAFDPALKPDRFVVGEYGAIGLHWPLSFAPIPSVK